MRLLLLGTAFLTIDPGLATDAAGLTPGTAILIIDPRLATDAVGLTLFVIVSLWSRASRPAQQPSTLLRRDAS